MGNHKRTSTPRIVGNIQIKKNGGKKRTVLAETKLVVVGEPREPSKNFDFTGWQSQNSDKFPAIGSVNADFSNQGTSDGNTEYTKYLDIDQVLENTGFGYTVNVTFKVNGTEFTENHDVYVVDDNAF